MLLRVDRILLRVPNVESAARFYRDVLGLQLVRQDRRLALLRLAGAETELVLHCDPDLPDNALYYLVASVRDLYARRDELKLSFVKPPAPGARGFHATARDPFGNVLLLIDRGNDAPAGGQVEDAKAPAGLFAGVEPQLAPKREALTAIYERIGRTADDLPYTPEFEKLYHQYSAAHSDPKPSRGEVWRHLLNLRKGGKLPKLGAARSAPPEITPEARQVLHDLIKRNMGKRDRLPYTEQFDAIVDEFNKTQQRSLSPHLVWRLVATLAK